MGSLLIKIGLSPRVRGNPYQGRTRSIEWGSIPACAGEPETNVLKVMENAVYPRVCGGTVALRRGSWVSDGLSPRVRGNPLCLDASAPHRWSIPACAGEPTSRMGRKRRDMVYPRVCGGTGAALEFGRM